jgi:hypothetical protein
MFRRPSDPPELPVPIRGSEAITALHAEWARLHAAPVASGSLVERLRRTVRAQTSRIGLGNDRKLSGDLIRAVDAVAARCDDLSDRVSNLEVTLDDLTLILGEEVTRLRAAVERIEAEASGEASSFRQ